MSVSEPKVAGPAADLRPSDDLGRYRRAVDDVLRSNHDVWGEQVLALADGPTFEAVADYLLPVALGDPVFLVESGAHYIVCTEPVGSESVALHVADGSQIVVDYIPTSATPEWAAAPPPRTRGGEHLLTYDFVVDPGTTGDSGSLGDLGSARLREGWLPILIVEYRGEEGVRLRRESFATRATDTGDLVNYVRFDASDLGLRTAVRVLTRDHRQADPLRRTDEFSLGAGDAELFLRLANGLSDDPVRVVTREEYVDARSRCTDYWSRTIASGCVIDVPDTRVMDALRNLLVQNLILGENYSIGNPYERTFLMEAHGATMPLLRYGYTERATECLELLAGMTNGSGPEWYESWERGTKLAAAAEHYRLCRDRAFIDRHSARYLNYIRDFQRQRRQDPHGLLAPERYAWDIPEQVYGWHSQAVAWDGLRAIVPVLIECGHLAADSDLLGEIEEFRLSLTKAMEAASTQLPDGSRFVPVSLLGDEKPYESLTESRLSNYWNLVAPYAMATAIVPPGSDLARGLLRYLEVHGAWLLGLTRFNGLYDPPTPIGSVNEDGTGGYKTPGIDNAFGVRVLEFLTNNGEADRLALALYGKLAHGMTRGTFVDGEATTVGACDGEFYRSTWYPPNGTSNALFLDALRDLLVRERPGTDSIGSTVELGWAIPRHWLRDGQHVAVAGLPTAFGPASFRIDSNLVDGHVDVTVGGSLTCPRMTVHLRVPSGYVVRSAADGGGRTVRWDATTEAVVLEPKGESITVRVRVEAVR